MARPVYMVQLDQTRGSLSTHWSSSAINSSTHFWVKKISSTNQLVYHHSFRSRISNLRLPRDALHLAEHRRCRAHCPVSQRHAPLLRRAVPSHMPERRRAPTPTCLAVRTCHWPDAHLPEHRHGPYLDLSRRVRLTALTRCVAPTWPCPNELCLHRQPAWAPPPSSAPTRRVLLPLHRSVMQNLFLNFFFNFTQFINKYHLCSPYCRLLIHRFR